MKRLFLIVSAWYLFTNSSETCKEPLYYTVYEFENVTIKYSRSVYYDINGRVEKTTEKRNKIFGGKSEKEINFNTSYNILKEKEKKRKKFVKEYSF